MFQRQLSWSSVNYKSFWNHEYGITKEPEMHTRSVYQETELNNFTLLFSFISWKGFQLIFDQIKDLLPLQIRNKLFYVYRLSNMMELITSKFIHKLEWLNRWIYVWQKMMKGCEVCLEITTRYILQSNL